VVVAVDELGQLWVRYWGPRGLADRHLPMPTRAEQIPLVVSLSVGNLVRQEAFELLRDIERRRASTPAPQPPLPRRASPVRARSDARAKPRNSWGHYLVGDFVHFPTLSRSCAPESNYRCYDSQGSPVTWDIEGWGVAGGLNVSHARYVMSYARELTPLLWASVRAGIAFTGGTKKNLAAKSDPTLPKFMPLSFELRLQGYPFGGPTSGRVRPYVSAQAGISEEVAEVAVTGPPPPLQSESQSQSAGQDVTTISAVGLLFAGAGLGVSVPLFDDVRLEAELSGCVAFPSTGWFVRPSAGLSYDF